MKVDIYSSKKKKAKSVQDVYKTIKKKKHKTKPWTCELEEWYVFCA